MQTYRLVDHGLTLSSGFLLTKAWSGWNVETALFGVMPFGCMLFLSLSLETVSPASP